MVWKYNLPVELFSFPLIQLCDDIAEGTLNAGDDYCGQLKSHFNNFALFLLPLLIFFFYLYLTRQVSLEQILIFNDGLFRGRTTTVPCQLGDLNLQPSGY